jgi:excisionase family DNA binding protein
MHEFLTVKEVAELLRIKERKLYDLTGEGAIPVTKVTGKLIFPRDALMAWLRRNTEYGAGLASIAARPAVVAGSHDPLLDWALRASGCGLATFYDGSTDGLARLKAGQAMAAGVHFYGTDEDGANVQRIRLDMPHEPVVIVAWAKRMQGLIVQPEIAREIGGIADVAGRRVVFRQEGAGSRALFSHLLREAAVDEGRLESTGAVAHSELDLAEAVAHGSADIGFGVEAVARQHRLAFIPLHQENFDLVVWRRDFCEPAMQALMAFARSPAFAERASQLGGYDAGDVGTVRYNGP